MWRRRSSCKIMHTKLSTGELPFAKVPTFQNSQALRPIQQPKKEKTYLTSDERDDITSSCKIRQCDIRKYAHRKLSGENRAPQSGPELDTGNANPSASESPLATALYQRKCTVRRGLHQFGIRFAVVLLCIENQLVQMILGLLECPGNNLSP